MATHFSLPFSLLGERRHGETGLRRAAHHPHVPQGLRVAVGQRLRDVDAAGQAAVREAIDVRQAVLASGAA